MAPRIRERLAKLERERGLVRHLGPRDEAYWGAYYEVQGRARNMAIALLAGRSFSGALAQVKCTAEQWARDATLLAKCDGPKNTAAIVEGLARSFAEGCARLGEPLVDGPRLSDEELDAVHNRYMSWRAEHA
jgi:hypothetical protein